jgi:hypothetical protein
VLFFTQGFIDLINSTITHAIRGGFAAGSAQAVNYISIDVLFTLKYAIGGLMDVFLNTNEIFTAATAKNAGFKVFFCKKGIFFN